MAETNRLGILQHILALHRTRMGRRGHSAISIYRMNEERLREEGGEGRRQIKCTCDTRHRKDGLHHACASSRHSRAPWERGLGAGGWVDLKTWGR